MSAVFRRFGGCCALGMMLATALPATAADGPQQLLDRQQDADAVRRERALDDLFLPGADAAAPLPALPDDQPCFPVSTITLTGATELLASARAAAVLAGWRGRCMGVQGVRRLQAELTEVLVADGRVTSRVLLPEQQLASGELILQVVRGQLERYDSALLSPRTLRFAFPAAPGATLELPALEQGIENLGRLPGLNPHINLQPGAEEGGSLVQVNIDDGRRWQAQGTLTGQALALAPDAPLNDPDSHGRVALTLGNLLGVADRIVLGAGRKLDAHRLDHSTDAGIDIDLPFGYWKFAASHDDQRYRDRVPGVLTTFRAEGNSQTTRLEASRVLLRRGHRRLALALVAGHSETANRIDDVGIAVSSYRLDTWAARLEHSTLRNRTRWTSWLTLEQGHANGPATRPLGGPSVADVNGGRAQIYLQALHPFANGNTVFTATGNGQYSASRLFPLQQLSLTADSAVRGFTDGTASGNNGLALRGELSHHWQRLSARVPGELQPYAGLDLGWLPNRDNEVQFVRLASASAGVLWSGARWQGRLTVTNPVGALSTLQPTDSTLGLSLAGTY